MASVRFENVSISYGAKQVVKDFSLSVNDGEIMGIIGPSGCGKTTLIRALCGLIKPEKGNIYINDQLVFSDEKRINVAPERRGDVYKRQTIALRRKRSIIRGVWSDSLYC